MLEAANQTDAEHFRTFAVDEVVRAEQPVWEESLSDHVAKRFQRKIVAIPGPNRQVINSAREARAAWNLQRQERMRSLGQSVDQIKSQPLDEAVSRSHPLIDAVGTAFAQHRPLTLSPDSIWLVIEQGFSHHVLENAEHLRARLVRHEGKKELFAQVPDLSLHSFEMGIQQFSQQIREETNQVLHETLVCNFSTTTPEIRTASEVVLMDCFSAYFEYSMMCVCGIPYVTLTGSADDWRSIRERVEVFAAYDLEWWLVRLRPILDELVRSAEGLASTQFWQSIYKPQAVYGGTSITGWIGDLFPYLGDAPRRRRNHIFQIERIDWGIPIKDGVNSFGGGARGVSQKSFPTGLSSAPVGVRLPDDSKNGFDLLGGFLGVTQNQQDLSLSPMIGWAVAEPVVKPAPSAKITPEQLNLSLRQPATPGQSLKEILARRGKKID